MPNYTQEKKSSYRSKFEEKPGQNTKFGFSFDEQKINHHTQIPEIPSKLKSCPDEKVYNKKLEDINIKYQKLKEERKKIKQENKNSTVDFDHKLKVLEGHIELGNKCLIVLRHDLKENQASLEEVSSKIDRKTKLIRTLQRAPRQNKRQTKSYEQMTYEQLQIEQERISSRVSTANLSKKQEVELNSILSKLARHKLSAKHGEKPKDNLQDIQQAQESIEKLKIAKNRLEKEESQINQKIQSIEQDIQGFEAKTSETLKQKKKSQNKDTIDHAAKLKDQILKLREQKENLIQDLQRRKAEYDYEQAKIEWIKWATQIQAKKNAAWEQQKQQRRRQKLKQKLQEKGDKNVKPEDIVEKAPINKNQKQIDVCTFLIQYVQGLIESQQQSKDEAPKQVKNVQNALKTGEWLKQKGIQVVKSKKSNLDEEQPEKPKKKKTKLKQPETTNKPNVFNHNIFIQQAFDSVKVLPPTKAEQIQPIVKQLNNKLAYFLSNPFLTANPEPKQQKQQQKQKSRFVQKPNKTSSKGNNNNNSIYNNKKVINTEDFPILG